MSKILSRADILAADDIKKIKISVPEWGGEVLVRTMTGDERDQFEDFCNAKGGKSIAGVMALLLSMTIADESGHRLFSVDDVGALGKKSAAAISRLYMKSRKLNALTQKDIEDLAGN